jgi:hypothetical protein
MMIFTLAPPLLFKSRPAVTAPLSGRTVKLNVDESFSLKLTQSIQILTEGLLSTFRISGDVWPLPVMCGRSEAEVQMLQ